MKVEFPFDGNITLDFPEEFNGPDGAPYRWFEQYKFNASSRESKMRKCITECLSKGVINRSSNILDSGAFIGDNALPWAKNIDGIVFAIDPSPTNLRLIEEVARLNGINNIKTIKEVLSSEKKVLSFNGEIDFNSFVGSNGEHQIISSSIDLLVEQGVVTDLGYIHLDIEGAELEALKGSRKALETFQPVVGFEQHIINDETLAAITSLLSDIDYTLYMIDEISGANLDCRNFLSIPARLLHHFTSSFDRMDCLIKTGHWNEEIARVTKLLEIEKQVAGLRAVSRHPYEISKLTAIISSLS